MFLPFLVLPMIYEPSDLMLLRQFCSFRMIFPSFPPCFIYFWRNFPKQLVRNGDKNSIKCLGFYASEKNKLNRNQSFFLAECGKQHGFNQVNRRARQKSLKLIRFMIPNSFKLAYFHWASFHIMHIIIHL